MNALAYQHYEESFLETAAGAAWVSEQVKNLLEEKPVVSVDGDGNTVVLVSVVDFLEAIDDYAATRSDPNRSMARMILRTMHRPAYESHKALATDYLGGHHALYNVAVELVEAVAAKHEEHSSSWAAACSGRPF